MTRQSSIYKGLETTSSREKQTELSSTDSCKQERILCTMALSTGRNDICSSVVQNHFKPGMNELVSFAQSLIEVRTDVSMCHKMRGHISRASQEMHKALEETEGGLWTIDAKSVELVAQKQRLESDRQAQTQHLRNLRHQLDSHQTLERSSREMLATARRHLEEMQRQLTQKEEEAREIKLVRNIGIGLMFIPPLGPIVGGGMALVAQNALEKAQRAVRDADAEADRHSGDVKRYSAETRKFQELEREAEVNIQTSERRLSSTEREKRRLTSQQREVVILQNTLRKCVTFLAMLAGKVDMAEFLSRDIVIYEELIQILEEILSHVFPLMGQGNETCVWALSSLEIRVLIGRLESAKQNLRLQGPSQRWGNVAIDF